jgi:hypothetical protein
VIRALAVALAVAIAAPTVAHAQPGGPPGAARREKIKKKIRALRAYTLTEELALDEQTAGRLFPVLQKYDDLFDKLLVERADLQRRMTSGPELKDPRALDKLVDDAIANQRAFWDAQDKRLTELRKILTPAQTAKLLVVLPALEKKIQNQIQRAIRGGGPARPGKGPLGPTPYDDDDDDDGPRLKGR